jgi:integrase
LADAREAAQECRKWRTQGLDPITGRKERRIATQLEAAKSITFKDCAEQYLAAHGSAWKNNRHTWKWERSLELYAYPILGHIPVGAIDTDWVYRAIDAIWRDKNETASRVRGRIEQILDWARVRGFREGDNPARWKGNLEHLLPPKEKVKRTQHMNALPYADMPVFWHTLSERSTTAAAMLRFTILTATRTGDTRFAVWDEIDIDEAVWVIPAERMKAGKEHRVALSPHAIQVLRAQAKHRVPVEEGTSDYIFPGPKKGKPHSENAMLNVLEQMGYKGTVTVHGFRSTFKVWASEQTDYSNEISEMALAHAISNAVEAAYKRTDLLDKRRALMDEWAAFCAGKQG